MSRTRARVRRNIPYWNDGLDGLEGAVLHVDVQLTLSKLEEVAYDRLLFAGLIELRAERGPIDIYLRLELLVGRCRIGGAFGVE